MKLPSCIILTVLLLATGILLLAQPLLQVLLIGVLIAVSFVSVARSPRRWTPALNALTRMRAARVVGLAFPLLVLVAVGTMVGARPQTHITYVPGGMATERGISSQRGFYSLEADPAGNHFVWTQERATLVFSFLVHRPITLTVEMRSAAIAGGADAPVRVIVDGRDVGALRPDPKTPTFQSLRLRFVPFDWGGQQTEIKLLPTAFKPKGDNRVLGTMVRRVTVDTSEAWSPISRRMWLLAALPVLAVLAFGCHWLARRSPTTSADYGVLIVSGVGALDAALVLALVLSIGVIQWDTYVVWVLGAVVSGMAFVAQAAAQPLRQRDGRTLGGMMGERIAAYDIASRVRGWKRTDRPPDADEEPAVGKTLIRDLAAVFVIALGVRLIWVALVPPWQAPDESDHFIYVAHIAEQKEIPHPPYASNYPLYPQEDIVSRDLTLLDSIVSGTRDGRPLPFLPVAYDYQAARDYQAPPEDRRGYAGARASGYPPLYYAYGAIPYRLFSRAPIVTRLFAVRCGSALLGALSCVFAYLLGRDLRRTRRWGQALGLCMALFPMYVFSSATVNNDTAMNLAAVALIWLIVRLAQQSEFSLPLALAVGMVSALAMLTKQTVAPVVAVAGMVILVRAVQTARSAGPRGAIASFGAYAAGITTLYGPWILFRLRYYGDVGYGVISLGPLVRFFSGATAVSAASSPAAPDATAMPLPIVLARISPWEFLFQLKDRGWPYFHALLIHDFWGNFGWLDASLPDRVFTPIVVVYVIGAIGLIVQLILQSRRRSILAILLCLLAAQAIFLFIGVDYYVGYVRTGRELGLQGRYFFPVLAPLLFLLLSGWDHLCRERPIALRLAPLGMLILQFISLGTILARYYGVVMR